MHKKLKKYIESYDQIQKGITYELRPNGGMIVLINQENQCEVLIENETYQLQSNQSMLINAYETPVTVQSTQNINLIAIRFKGAGASFFYEEYMDELMHNPKEPISLENNIQQNEYNEKELDTYFQNRFKPSALPFNIMKIIDLLDEQGSDYNIDEVLAIANCPRKILDKAFRLRAGITFKTYASLVKKAS